MNYVIKNNWFLIFISFMIFNSIFWLIEDFNGMEHKLYWFDQLSVILHLIAGVALDIWIKYNGYDTKDDHDSE